MATLLAGKREAATQIEHICANCRGVFYGMGYKKGGRSYCCDVCYQRSGRGLLSSLSLGGILVALGYYLALRR